MALARDIGQCQLVVSSTIPGIFIFDVGGKVDAFLNAYVEVGWCPFCWEGSWDLATVTILDFELDRPDSEAGDEDLVLGEVVGNTLHLNIGPRAGDRSDSLGAGDDAIGNTGARLQSGASAAAGRGSGGGKRFVGGFSGQSGKDGDEKSLIKRFDLGAGAWALGDEAFGRVGQPTWADVAGHVLSGGGDTQSSDHMIDRERLIERLQKEMKMAASRLDFERAAQLRDRIFQLDNGG